MKKILILGAGLALAALASCNDGKHYGKPFADFPKAELAALVEKPADFYRKDVRIEGPVTRQCPATGCWFYVGDGNGKELKVEMGDTVPKIPPQKGKTAIVEGKLIPFGTGTQFVGVAAEFKP